MEKDVLVYCGEGEEVRQPDTFRCCPLGLQFYSKRELPTYRVLELQVRVPDRDEKEAPTLIDCSGVVVHSQWDPEKNMYRTWVMFADLPEEMRERFRCISKESDFLCPHCENY